MSWRASAWAKRVKTGSPAVKAVLLCLADYADEDDTCWPGQERLAAESEQSVRSVRRHLDALEGMGVITREHRYNGAGHRTSDRYLLHVDTPGVEYITTGQDDPKAPSGQSDRRSPKAKPTGQSDPAYRTPVAGEQSVEPSKEEPPDSKTGDKSPALVDLNDGRADVERLCTHLSESLTERQVKHTITKAWRDAARLMLDRDGRTEQQVHNMIEWSAKSAFWAPNIHSMPTLREKYDRMREQAMRDADGAPSNRHDVPDSPGRAKRIAALGG